MWPKKKSFVAPERRWESLKLRPLDSYAKHHWRRLMTYCCKCLNCVVSMATESFSISSHGELMEKIAAFNECDLGSVSETKKTKDWCTLPWTTLASSSHPYLEEGCSILSPECVSVLPTRPATATCASRNVMPGVIPRMRGAFRVP